MPSLGRQKVYSASKDGRGLSSLEYICQLKLILAQFLLRSCLAKDGLCSSRNPFGDGVAQVPLRALPSLLRVPAQLIAAARKI